MKVFPLLESDEATSGCGMGMGETCCAYLTVGGDGIECGRVLPQLKSMVEARVAAGTFTAQRLPQEPYPDCQLPND